MRRSLLSIVAAAALLVLAGAASAQTATGTTTTGTTGQGTAIREYSTTKHYESYSDPAFQSDVGIAVPDSMTLHPLPERIQIAEPERYSYTIVNDRPVIVERGTRRVVHTWQ
jgi:hypothetical protein